MNKGIIDIRWIATLVTMMIIGAMYRTVKNIDANLEKLVEIQAQEKGK